MTLCVRTSQALARAYQLGDGAFAARRQTNPPRPSLAALPQA